MGSIVLSIIAQMMKSEYRYVAYTVRYSGDETDTLIVVPHENFDGHIRYLWNHFFMDGNAYSAKSPVRFIHNFIFCNSMEEIEHWKEWFREEAE